VKRWLRVAGIVQTAVLLLAGAVGAQVRLGQLSTNLSGTVSPGYTAEYGNQTASDHSWTFGGAGTLSGSYFNPNFLSFDASFYLNQSRANSDFQSISNTSGVNASSTIFGGSHFPGSINYSKALNSEGNYDVPGLANYVTHGNSSTFGIGWYESLPNAPSFSAGYQMGNSQYSVYGINDQGTNSFNSLNLHSSYDLKGFNIGAFYANGSSHSLIPQLVSGQADTETRSNDNATGFNVAHVLPLQGSASASFNRSYFSSNYLGTTTSGTIDLVNAVAAVHPAQKVSLTVNADYSDNLSGQLLAAVVAAGGVVAGANSNQSSNSLDVMANASYTPIAELQTSVFAEVRNQTYLGETYGVASYGGSASYMRTLLHGTFNASGTVTENSNEQTGQGTLGFSTGESYSSEVMGWHVNGSFNYAQNVQTFLVTYMNSFYNYSFSARRNWGKVNVSGGAGMSHTGLTQAPGTADSSQSYNGSVGYGSWFSANGSYSQASGQALTTGSGLVPVPVPSPLLPSSLVSLYGGHSYSFGLSSSPVKKMIIEAAYADSTSNIANDGAMSTNQTDQFNVMVQYQTRKLYYSSGFARLEQGFSGSGTGPGIVNTFSIGVSRWFNVF
jgi:hypothetical protein